MNRTLTLSIFLSSISLILVGLAWIQRHDAIYQANIALTAESEAIIQRDEAQTARLAAEAKVNSAATAQAKVMAEKAEAEVNLTIAKADLNRFWDTGATATAWVIKEYNLSSTADTQMRQLHSTAEAIKATATVQAILLSTAQTRLNMSDQETKMALATAEANFQMALARQLIAQTQAISYESATKLLLSTRLTIEAFRRYPSTESEQVLRAILAQLPRADIQFIPGGRGVVFSPYGHKLATGSDNGFIIVQDMLDRQSISRLSHGNGRVWPEAFTSDDRYLISSSYDTIKVWEVKTGQEIAQIRTEVIYNVALSPDGQWIAAGSDNWYMGPDRVRVWETTTGKEVAVLEHWRADYITFSPDSRWLVTAGGDTSEEGNVRVWEVVTGRELYHLNHGKWPRDKSYPGDWITDLAFSPDGRWFATAGDDGIARIWETKTGQEVKSFKHNQEVWDVDFSPDGRWLATGSGNSDTDVGGKVSKWEIATGIESLAIPQANRVTLVLFSPDGKYLATTTNFTTVKLWDAASGLAVNQFVHEDRILGLTFSPHGPSWLATGNEDGIVRLWLVNSLAQPIETENLVAEACARLTHNLSVKEWQQYLGDEPYRLTCSNLPIHPSFIEIGQELARAGDLTGAVVHFNKALALDPNLKLDPAIEAQRIYANSLVSKGVRLAQQGDITQTFTIFAQAKNLYPPLEIASHSWSEVCWHGSLWGSVTKVIPSCDQAVKLAPESTDAHDSRGLARALAGDYPGAIADFEFVVKWVEKNAEYKINSKWFMRPDWLAELKAGHNPFDAKIIQLLQGMSKW